MSDVESKNNILRGIFEKRKSVAKETHNERSPEMVFLTHICKILDSNENCVAATITSPEGPVLISSNIMEETRRQPSRPKCQVFYTLKKYLTFSQEQRCTLNFKVVAKSNCMGDTRVMDKVVKYDWNGTYGTCIPLLYGISRYRVQNSKELSLEVSHHFGKDDPLSLVVKSRLFHPKRGKKGGTLVSNIDFRVNKDGSTRVGVRSTLPEYILIDLNHFRYHGLQDENVTWQRFIDPLEDKCFRLFTCILKILSSTICSTDISSLVSGSINWLLFEHLVMKLGSKFKQGAGVSIMDVVRSVVSKERTKQLNFPERFSKKFLDPVILGLQKEVNKLIGDFDSGPVFQQIETKLIDIYRSALKLFGILKELRSKSRRVRVRSNLFKFLMSMSEKVCKIAKSQLQPLQVHQRIVDVAESAFLLVDNVNWFESNGKFQEVHAELKLWKKLHDDNVKEKLIATSKLCCEGCYYFLLQDRNCVVSGSSGVSFANWIFGKQITENEAVMKQYFGELFDYFSRLSVQSKKEVIRFLEKNGIHNEREWRKVFGHNCEIYISPYPFRLNHNDDSLKELDGDSGVCSFCKFRTEKGDLVRMFFLTVYFFNAAYL